MLLERDVSAETSDKPMAEPKAAMMVEMAAERTAPPRIVTTTSVEPSDMASPLTEDQKGQDDHDETNQINDAVHESPHQMRERAG